MSTRKSSSRQVIPDEEEDEQPPATIQKGNKKVKAAGTKKAPAKVKYVSYLCQYSSFIVNLKYQSWPSRKQILSTA
jgi:hypothetical protein